MTVFATLGPAGSNHDYVTRRYLRFHNLERASIKLFAQFDAAFEHLVGGQVDYLVQVAVHPSVASCVATFRGRAHLVDAFIGPSQPMAVLTRIDVERPRSLGLQPATRDYCDVSRWETLVAEPSTVDVAQGLVDGKYDSGITLSRFATEHEALLRVDENIGQVSDPWLVFSARQRRWGTRGRISVSMFELETPAHAIDNVKPDRQGIF